MSSDYSKQSGPIGRYRWVICALIFFATTINYLDRNVLGLLKDTLLPLLRLEPGSTGEKEYAGVVMAFQIAYAIGLLGIGRLIDRVGSKHGYAASLFGWSFAAIGHGFAAGPLSFGFWRAALGLTEAGNFPAANKTVAEWFPRKERALATGIYNSGANIGSIVAPLCVPWLATHYFLGWSWQWAFVLTGAIGLIWLAFWYAIYQSPTAKLAAGKLTQAEYEYIHSDRDERAENSAGSAREKVSWFKLLGYRQTWAFFFGKFFTDPVWWFYLFWLPAFLSGENKHKIMAVYPNGLPDGITMEMALKEMQKFTNLFGSSPLLDKLDVPGLIVWPLAVAVIYSISTVGSIFGGYLPKLLVDRGMDVNRARKTAMFIYALVPLTVLGAMRLGEINTWLAVLVIGLACAAHQAWSANIFTTVSDMFPKKAVASVTGIGGMAGALGGLLIAALAGVLLDYYAKADRLTVGYAILFVVCALAYIAAWLIMHFFVPRFKRITDL
jgi:ACS family hexuronate transporter-like MFS transporter